jgi:hypothetical protein
MISILTLQLSIIINIQIIKFIAVILLIVGHRVKIRGGVVIGNGLIQ